MGGCGVVGACEVVVGWVRIGLVVYLVLGCCWWVCGCRRWGVVWGVVVMCNGARICVWDVSRYSSAR